MERNLVLPAQPPCLETDVFEAEKTQPYLEAKLYIERIEQESKKCQDEKCTDTTHEPLEGLEPLEHGVSLTMYPVRVPNVHFSCATVQWDMPQMLTDDPSADSACTDELNSSGGASLDWTINPLSSDKPCFSQENVIELIQEKEIGQLDTEVELKSGPARTVENNDNSCQTCDQDTVENIFVTPSYEDSQELLKEDKVDIGLKMFENNPDRTESSICTEKIQLGFESSETQTEEEPKQLGDTTPNLTQPKQVLGDLCKDKESMCLYLTERDETDNVNNGGMCQMGNMDYKGDQSSTHQTGTSGYLEQEPDLVGESDQTLLDGITIPLEPADQQPNCICDVSVTVEATDQTTPKQDLIELSETKLNSVQPILVATLDIISDEKLQTEQLQSAETFQKMKGSAWAICEDQTESSVEMKRAEQSECSTRLELSEHSHCSDEVEQSKQPNSQNTEQSTQLSNELKPECSTEPSEVPEVPKETQPSDQSNQLERSSEISEDSKVPKEIQPSEQSTQSGCSEDDEPSEQSTQSGCSEGDEPSEQPVQSESSEDDEPSEQPVQSECSNQTEPVTLSHLQDSEPTQEADHPDQQGNEQQIHIEVKQQNEDKEPSACEDHSEHTEHRNGSIEQPEREKQESVALVVPCQNSKVEVVDREEAKRLAEKLYKLENVQRTDVVRHLDKDNEFSRAVGEEYLKFFDFTDQSLDEALRSFLLEVVLIGETQERERVLERFSGRYHQCNPSSFSSPGSVLTLTCAVMLLNTDIHGQNVGKAMSSTDFVSNLDGMNEGENFSKDLLKTLYNSIKNHPLEWAVEEQVLVKSMILEQDSDQDSTLRSKSNPFQDLAHDKKATVFQKGFLKRKAHADIDGKRTPWGKRSWKTFYAVLKGMVLYLQKDEYRKDWQSSEEVLSVHHSLAERAEDYTKRPYVFRLQTADWRVFLFEAASTEQMNSWIGRINLVSALYSSPPFPAAVGSQRRFCRPILPATQSTLSLEKQLQSHAATLQSFQEDLSALQQGAPESRKAKARDLEDHRHKEEYLQHERCRYEAYVQILEVWQKLGKTSEMDGGTDLALFDQELWKGLAVEMEDPDETDGGMKRSHSSPSLELELAPPPVVKVRRNISERRTYRKIIVPRRNKEL